MATIIIPTPLRKFTDWNRTFETDRETLAQALDHLVITYPDLQENLLDENGHVRSYIRIYIGEDEADPVKDKSLKLDQQTEISIVPAIAGGSIKECHG